MKSSGIITLMTDFGMRDTFVGEIKGVILTLNRNATIIDITHEVEAFNILEASLKLSSYLKYFPQGTVHMVVVDPGVGSQRRGIIVESMGYYFVGPDNGLFTPVIKGNSTIYEITEYVEGFTFHGRDLFAPISAGLSRDESPESMGRRIDDPVIINLPEIKKTDNIILGEIILIDRFGNCITNVKDAELKNRRFAVYVRDMKAYLCRYYKEGESHGLSCLINSSGYLEIFKYTSSASDEYDLRLGDPLRIELF